MSLDDLKRQTAAYLEMTCPSLEDSSPLVEECFDNALKSFNQEFICLFRPETWGKITIIYHSHFLDTGIDITIGEIFSVVIRDSISNNRMNFLTQSLAQQKMFEKNSNEVVKKTKQKPTLTVVKNNFD